MQQDIEKQVDDAVINSNDQAESAVAQLKLSLEPMLPVLEQKRKVAVGDLGALFRSIYRGLQARSIQVLCSFLQCGDDLFADFRILLEGA